MISAHSKGDETLSPSKYMVRLTECLGRHLVKAHRVLTDACGFTHAVSDTVSNQYKMTSTRRSAPRAEGAHNYHVRWLLRVCKCLARGCVAISAMVSIVKIGPIAYSSTVKSDAGVVFAALTYLGASCSSD